MVDQPAERGQARGLGILLDHRPRGVHPGQVVEPVTARPGLLQQVRVEQLVDQPAGVRRGPADERGRRTHVQLDAGMQSEHPVRLPLFRVELDVGELERRSDAAVAHFELRDGPHVTQAVDEMRRRPRRPGAEARRREPDRQREPPAQLDHLGQPIRRFRAPNTAPRAADEQRDGVLGRQEIQRVRARDVEAGEPGPAGDHHQTAARRGEEGSDLRLARGVVEEHEHPPPGEEAAVEGGPVVHVAGDVRPRDPERAQQPVERVTRVDGRDTTRVTLQIEEELAVWIATRPPVSGVDGEGRLADPRHPVDGDDHRTGPGPHLLERLEIGVPPGELRRCEWELPRHRDGGYGRTRRNPARLARGRFHEERQFLGLRPERVDQPAQRAALRTSVRAAALQSADGANAQSGALGQLLLGEERPLAQGSQQIAEPGGPVTAGCAFLGPRGHRGPPSSTHPGRTTHSTAHRSLSPGS